MDSWYSLTYASVYVYKWTMRKVSSFVLACLQCAQGSVKDSDEASKGDSNGKQY